MIYLAWQPQRHGLLRMMCLLLVIYHQFGWMIRELGRWIEGGNWMASTCVTNCRESRVPRWNTVIFRLSDLWSNVYISISFYIYVNMQIGFPMYPRTCSLQHGANIERSWYVHRSQRPDWTRKWWISPIRNPKYPQIHMLTINLRFLWGWGDTGGSGGRIVLVNN